MISIRSVIGALRKTLKICGSVLVRKVDVSGTSKGGIGGGVCAIKICLTFGLIDRPEERDVCSGCVNVIDSSVLDSQRMTRLGRGWSSSSRTDIGCRISLPGTHDTERPIREFAVNRALAASRTRGMIATDSLSKGGCSLLVHIRPYSIFLFSITGYFYFRRVVRNDSLVRRLRRQRSRRCAPLDV
jgi:hypothetical protein